MTPDDQQPMRVSRAEADDAVQRVLDVLPEAWRVMPIGGNAVEDSLDRPGRTTKDVDLVLVVLRRDGPAIPTTHEIRNLLDPALEQLTVRKDQTSLAGFLVLPEGRVKVEVIRGRSTGAGGYFVSRSVLETAASLSQADGRVLRAPMEVLAFLKAWGATDQDKLVANEKDARGFHRDRAMGFRKDVTVLREAMAEQGRTPDDLILRRLLDATGGPRRKQVEAALRQGGWGASLDDSTDAP